MGENRCIVPGGVKKRKGDEKERKKETKSECSST
jgi:hypothetical protein